MGRLSMLAMCLLHLRLTCLPESGLATMSIMQLSGSRHNVQSLVTGHPAGLRLHDSGMAAGPAAPFAEDTDATI